MRAGLDRRSVSRLGEPETFGEKIVAPSVLFVLVLVPFVKPLLDPLDTRLLKDRYQGEVCLQSTFSTCGPASAATLLRSFGIVASERELAYDSFTSRGGTEIWYLARALRKRGVGTSVVIRPRPDSDIPSPAIAGVVLPGNAGHFIAILGSDAQHVTIADPLKGELVIDKSQIQNYYRFTGFFLVLRTSNESVHQN
jgi:ABC-type bacteriocin/lantibiotic exporter with double-glycine peptidase domain